MIPSTWFRRLILVLFVLEVVGALMWLATRLIPDPADRALSQTVAGIVFLLGFYTGGPLLARFLAPYPSRDVALRDRVSRVVSQLSGRVRVFLYDHADRGANTVGILARHSRVYVTSGLMEGVSDEGLKGILAHEDTHIQEHHILITFVYACAYAFLAYLTDADQAFVLGFLAFMALRRYLEYRADAGAAKLVGPSTVVKALQELHVMYPTGRWARWFNWAAPYPTIPMRIKAVETGRRPLL